MHIIHLQAQLREQKSRAELREAQDSIQVANSMALSSYAISKNKGINSTSVVCKAAAPSMPSKASAPPGAEPANAPVAYTSKGKDMTVAVASRATPLEAAARPVAVPSNALVTHTKKVQGTNVTTLPKPLPIVPSAPLAAVPSNAPLVYAKKVKATTMATAPKPMSPNAATAAPVSAKGIAVNLLHNLCARSTIVDCLSAFC